MKGLERPRGFSVCIPYFLTMKAFQININILFGFGYLHGKSGLVRSGGLTMFNAFKRMFQPGV